MNGLDYKFSRKKKRIKEMRELWELKTELINDHSLEAAKLYLFK